LDLLQQVLQRTGVLYKGDANHLLRFSFCAKDRSLNVFVWQVSKLNIVLILVCSNHWNSRTTRTYQTRTRHQYFKGVQMMMVLIWNTFLQILMLFGSFG